MKVDKTDKPEVDLQTGNSKPEMDLPIIVHPDFLEEILGVTIINIFIHYCLLLLFIIRLTTLGHCIKQ
jgi:hypothetical protein